MTTHCQGEYLLMKSLAWLNFTRICLKLARQIERCETRDAAYCWVILVDCERPDMGESGGGDSVVLDVT